MAACSEAFAVLYSFLQLAQAFVRAFSLPLSALAQALSLSFELPFILPFLSVFVLFKQKSLKTEFQAFSQKLYYLMSLLCKGYRVTHAHLDK